MNSHDMPPAYFLAWQSYTSPFDSEAPDEPRLPGLLQENGLDAVYDLAELWRPIGL